MVVVVLSVALALASGLLAFALIERAQRAARASTVSVTLDEELEAAWSLQIHFGEQTWWILGDEALAAALASSALRAATRPGDQLHMAEGTVTLLVGDAERARAGAFALREIALRLGRPGVALERLLEETARRDPDPRARAEAAPHLLARAPSWAYELGEDAAPEVRLAVARSVGGERAFELAAEILTSEIFHADIQQAALRHLVSRHPPERVGPVLVAALGSADDNLQGALVPALADLRHAGAEEALHAALPTATLRNVARIAEALAAIEGPSAEPTLIELLGRVPSTGPSLPDERDLATSAADALGRVGSSASLGPLSRLAATVSPESPVGISAKVALDLVRARTGGATLAGALALSPPSAEEDGRLSRI